MYHAHWELQGVPHTGNKFPEDKVFWEGSTALHTMQVIVRKILRWQIMSCATRVGDPSLA